MKSILSRLGPGLLYAGAAVGVSHLVQSTRAGANYGLIMTAVVIIANLIKYPFFKAGPIYAAVTGKSLLDAFHESGRWAMGLFYLVTISAVFVVQAVVTLLTASVFASIFELSIPLWQISCVLLLICSCILIIGRYRVLDHVMKWVIILLTITTLVTLIAAIFSEKESVDAVNTFSFLEKSDIFFLIALIGWMPAPLDISIWHSEWTLKSAQEKDKPLKLKDSLFDFNIGYWGTTVLAIAFVALGSLILNGKELPSSGLAFAGSLIGMYTFVIGKWAFVIIAIAAFTTMFSTTLTVLDAYPRVINKAIGLSAGKQYKYGYYLALGLTVIGAIYVLFFQLKNMKQLVDFATSVSFLTAPILASLIYWVVKKNVKMIFTRIDEILAQIGIVFLYCFSGYYIWIKFF